MSGFDWQEWQENKAKWYPQNAEAWRGIRCLLEWLEVRQQFEQGTENRLGFPQLLADVDHSALLARLLKGKSPLPAPPPTSHSYPWYGLVEEGSGELDPIFVEGVSDSAETGRVRICQSSWTVLRREGDTLIVRYDEANGEWVLSQSEKGTWLLKRREGEGT